MNKYSPTKNMINPIMKFLLLTLSLLAAIPVFSQVADSVVVRDTRNVQEPPEYFRNIVHFDFKLRDVIGVPRPAGSFTQGSGMMTFAPWGDSTGNNVHQLNFNNDGIYYRQGAQGSGAWQAWRKVLTSQGIQVIYGHLNLNYDDTPLSFTTDKSTSWQYIAYNSGGTRKAWVGMDTDNNFNITKENGGIIVLKGAGVGIGTASIGSCALAVEGTIGARKVKVTAGPWPDFVFEENYPLPSLAELSTYLKTNKHLPGIPSAAEVKNDGLDLGDMNAKLLQKVEELSLYIIQQNEKLEKITKELEILKSKIK